MSKKKVSSGKEKARPQTNKGTSPKLTKTHPRFIMGYGKQKDGEILQLRELQRRFLCTAFPNQTDRKERRHNKILQYEVLCQNGREEPVLGQEAFTKDNQEVHLESQS